MPAILALGVRGPVPKKVEGPSRHGKFPFCHGSSHALSKQSSHHLSRECHRPSRETFRFKPMPPFHQRTSRSSQMVRFEVESRTAVPILQSSIWMTSFTSGLLPRAPIVAYSRHRRSTSKKPSSGYRLFHHGPQLSSSATANNCFRPSATLTQLIRLSSNCSTRHVKINLDRMGSWSLWPVR